MVIWLETLRLNIERPIYKHCSLVGKAVSHRGIGYYCTTIVVVTTLHVYWGWTKWKVHGRSYVFLWLEKEVPDKKGEKGWYEPYDIALWLKTSVWWRYRWRDKEIIIDRCVYMG